MYSWDRGVLPAPAGSEVTPARSALSRARSRAARAAEDATEVRSGVKAATTKPGSSCRRGEDEGELSSSKHCLAETNKKRSKTKTTTKQNPNPTTAHVFPLAQKSRREAARPSREARVCACVCPRLGAGVRAFLRARGGKTQRRAFQPFFFQSRWLTKAAPETGLPEWNSGPCIIARRLPSSPSLRAALSSQPLPGPGGCAPGRGGAGEEWGE